MRKAFRITFLLLMPILFIALMAVCLSFEGAMAISSSASAGESTTGQVVVSAETVINIKGSIFEVGNWIANLQKSFKYSFDLSTGSFILAEDAATALNLGEGAQISLQLLSLFGILIFGIGFFLVEVGYGSKIATVIGTLTLVVGSIIIFTQLRSTEGIYYSFSVNSESGTQEVFSFRLHWLNLNLIAGLADGLALLNLIVILSKRQKIK